MLQVTVAKHKSEEMGTVLPLMSPWEPAAAHSGRSPHNRLCFKH